MRRTILVGSLVAAALSAGGPAAAEPMAVTLKNSANRLFTISGPWNIAPLFSGTMNTAIVENSTVTYTVAFNTSPWSMVCAATINHSFAGGISTCTYTIQPGSTPYPCTVTIQGSGTAQCTATLEVTN